ncbi:MAG: alpha-L-fucosidase [Faecalibacterium sp.]|nr:alpha-L-fucosidase [Ruminococcus sp.]MCM1391843.1 alpha-L-fucosidase [Ruminococcus sp.]MCM1485707.1 alpha-L-fucosidase [Faecalibacterium sp.]
MTEQERLDIYTSIVPNERQLMIQDIKFYAFVHYTVNTFTGKEWGDGKESLSVFNPTSQDTDQWCEAIKAAGMKGVVLTCKHHDGFCLWPTKTTEHCIRNSPYKNGKGDVVREVAESCEKYGLKFGVYLSPWDRNSPLYGTDAYNDFYIEQLTELLTNYGEIFMLWLDGACGSDADGKPKQKYDFERIWSTALKLQPNIVLSDCAPDVRWVGNESGIARESEWNVVPKFQYEVQNIAANFQSDDNMKKFQKRSKDVMAADIGSRDFLASYDSFIWYPAEVDVSIRRGWFYHPTEIFTLKSLKHLMKIYYGSVGSNSLLILNIPPNKKGQFCKADVRRLKQMGEWLRKEDECVIESCCTVSDDKMKFDISFEKQSVDRIRFSEDTTKSQRIESFKIYANDECVYSGTVVGFSKIAIFKKAVVTDRLQLVIEQCRKEPYIEKIEVCKTGAYRI